MLVSGIIINLLHPQTTCHTASFEYILQTKNDSQNRCSNHTTQSRRHHRYTTRTNTGRLRTRSSNLQPIACRHNRTSIHRRSHNTRCSRLSRASRPRRPRRLGTPRASSPARPICRRTSGLTPPCSPGLRAPVAARRPVGPRAVV
jgi:hypothetical protein